MAHLAIRGARAAGGIQTASAMGKDLLRGCTILALGTVLCMILALGGVGVVFYASGQDDHVVISANTDFDPGELGGSNARQPCNIPGAPFESGSITELTCASHGVILEEWGDVVTGGNCHRSGTGSDGDEHPLGQACDYMINTSDVWPDSTQRANGNRIALFARDNYEELGVYYIIWYDKIWNPRKYSEDEPDLPWSQWRQYAEGQYTGQLTLGHYDHPHISFCGAASPDPGTDTARPCPR